MLRAALRGGADVTLVCAGRDRQFALEDAGCAGRFVLQRLEARRPDIVLNDAAQACALIDRKYGDQIVPAVRGIGARSRARDAGFGDDLEACAAVDSYAGHPVLSGSADHQARTRSGAVAP